MEAAAVQDQLFTLDQAYEEIVGGERPTTYRLTGQGVKFDLPDGIKKGTLVKCEVVLRVGGTLNEDKFDSATDQVVDTIQTAKGRFVSGRVLGPVLEAVN